MNVLVAKGTVRDLVVCVHGFTRRQALYGIFVVCGAIKNGTVIRNRGRVIAIEQ